MTDTSITQRTADLDLIAYATLRALRNGASYDQVNDALAYTVARASRDPHAPQISTSRVGHPGAAFEELEAVLRKYGEWAAGFNLDNPTDAMEYDDGQVDRLKEIRDAAEAVVR